MSARFDLIRFNFMRAVEIFQDLNHDDMDVTAPPSSESYRKESELARKLDDYLNSLVEEGFFDDCELRDPTASSGSSSGEEDEEGEEGDGGEEDQNDEAQEDQVDYDSQRSTPRSAGFDYPSDRRSASGASEDRSSRSASRSDSRSRSHSSSGSDSNRGSASGASRGSLSDRFRRYIRRIIPGSSRSRSK